MTKFYSSNTLQNDRKINLSLFAPAEVSLTEKKKTGDSVVLFVASSTASQFNFTQAYDFEILQQNLKYNSFLHKEKSTNFKDVLFLDEINMRINDDGVRKLLRKIINLIQLKFKEVKEWYKNIYLRLTHTFCRQEMDFCVTAICIY